MFVFIAKGTFGLAKGTFGLAKGTFGFEIRESIIESISLNNHTLELFLFGKSLAKPKVQLPLAKSKTIL